MDIDSSICLDQSWTARARPRSCFFVVCWFFVCSLVAAPVLASSGYGAFQFGNTINEHAVCHQIGNFSGAGPTFFGDSDQIISFGQFWVGVALYSNGSILFYGCLDSVLSPYNITAVGDVISPTYGPSAANASSISVCANLILWISSNNGNVYVIGGYSPTNTPINAATGYLLADTSQEPWFSDPIVAASAGAGLTGILTQSGILYLTGLCLAGACGNSTLANNTAIGFVNANSNEWIDESLQPVVVRHAHMGNGYTFLLTEDMRILTAGMMTSSTSVTEAILSRPISPENPASEFWPMSYGSSDGLGPSVILQLSDRIFLDGNYTVWAWGGSFECLPTLASPLDMNFFDSRVQSVSAADGTHLALTISGNLYLWGPIAYSLLGSPGCLASPTLLPIDSSIVPTSSVIRHIFLTTGGGLGYASYEPACPNNNCNIISIPQSTNNTQQVVITQPSLVVGNLTISDSTSITLAFNTSDFNSSRALLNVTGCVTINGTLSLENFTQLAGSASNLSLISASCLTLESNYQLQLENAPSCTRHSSYTTFDNTTGYSTLVASLFTPTTISCNSWWIILTASLIGAVILLVVILAIVLRPLLTSRPVHLSTSDSY